MFHWLWPKNLTSPAIRRFTSSVRVNQRPRYTRFGTENEPRGFGGLPPFRKWDRPTQLLVGTCSAGGIYYIYHVERVEETGRWRFIDVSPETEQQVAAESNKEIIKQFADRILPPRHPVAMHVAHVASRIISSANLGTVKGLSHNGEQGGWLNEESWSSEAVAERLRQEWEVFVIQDDKNVNAFVTPGGKIFVFTGILRACANDDALATVLGHEIAHQVVRHSAEKMSGMKVFTALVVLLEILGLDVGLSRLGLTLFMTLPNSRSMEAEADQVGLRLMARACFDPTESTRFWQRMSAIAEHEGGGGRWGNFGKKLSDTDFLATHPANSKRIQNLERWIPDALSIRAASPCTEGGPSGIGRGFI